VTSLELFSLFIGAMTFIGSFWWCNFTLLIKSVQLLIQENKEFEMDLKSY